MIPLRDSLRSRAFPFVNYTIIPINIIVFIYELQLTARAERVGNQTLSAADRSAFDWGTVACRLT